MPMKSGKAVSILDNRYIFNDNLILLKDDSDTLPEEPVDKKYLEYQLASDWFCEPQLNYTALMLENGTPEPQGYRWLPLRGYFAAGRNDAPLAARAMGLLRWRRSAWFCPACGGALHDAAEETARKCIVCGRTIFPAIEPAVIVLIEKNGKLLLAKHANRNTNVYTCLAGFVEQGETIEDTVRREVREEAGIEIDNVRYVGSQSWPFPNQLMLAFRAEWKSGNPEPDKKELDDLKWFTRDDLPQIPPPGSVAWRLIMDKI
jgi:NAD+ diphosphatase